MCAEQSSAELVGAVIKYQVPPTETVSMKDTCRSEPNGVKGDRDAGALGEQKNRP